MTVATKEHDLKYQNRFHRLLRIIRQNPGITGTGLVLETQTFAAWQRRELLDDLISKGLIREEVEETGGRGRPKRRYFAIETQQEADSGQEPPTEEMAYFDASKYKNASGFIPVITYAFLTGRWPRPSEIEVVAIRTEEDVEESIKDEKLERARRRALYLPY